MQDHKPIPFLLCGLLAHTAEHPVDQALWAVLALFLLVRAILLRDRP